MTRTGTGVASPSAALPARAVLRGRSTEAASGWTPSRPGGPSGPGAHRRAARLSAASTPWSRSPARPAAASRRCSTCCPGTSLAVGVRRPTTSKAYASVWGSEGARRWCSGSACRGGRPPGGTGPDCARRAASSTGWCCSTCPTTTRPVVEHQHEVDRLVELVDLLVWVVDPQKYADKVLHERYLRRLAGHERSMVVVLNQVDTAQPVRGGRVRRGPAPAARRGRAAPVAGARRSSARTGAGIDGLRALLADAVRHPTGARNDGWSPTSRPSPTPCAPGWPSPSATPASCPGAASWSRPWRRRPACRSSARAVEESWQLRAGAARSAGRRPAGCRGCGRTRCAACTSSGEDKQTVRAALVRSSVPEPTPVQRAQVDTALRQVCDAVRRGPAARRGSAGPRGRSTGARRTCATAGPGRTSAPTSVVDRMPLWWRAGAARAVAARAAAVVGALWLLALAFGCYLRLPETRRRRRSAGFACRRCCWSAGCCSGCCSPPARPARPCAAARRRAPAGRVAAAGGDREGRRRADARAGGGRAGPARPRPGRAGARRTG